MSIDNNFKENVGNQGLIGAAESGAQGEFSTIGLATGWVGASDNATQVNSGNTTLTNNILDPGAIAAGQAIAQSGIDLGQDSLGQAIGLVNTALQRNTELAKQTEAGPLANILKPIGFLVGGLFALWIAFKIVMGLFSRKAAAQS